jgi:Phosphotransferase enzyme family
VPAPLTERAVGAAVTVARGYGVPVARPRVIRDLSNVLVELAPAPVVARVATTTAAARADGARDWLAREVALAGFLAECGAAVVPPASELPPGPHIEDGFAISFWRLVHGDESEPPSSARTGQELCRLHDSLADFPGALPGLGAVLDEAEALIGWTGQSGAMLETLSRARAEIDAAARPARPLHGDAHRGNLLDTAAGLLWTDFEDTCAGPVEWDLACLVAVSADREEALAAYAPAADVEALDWFVEARLIQVAAWTAFMAEHHPHLRERAAQRLSRWR